jgi:ABC-type transport system involved in multi-copper enzyme maturation permease subunit
MSTARIVDRSYRPYEGARGGVGTSMLTVVKHSIQRSLGIKRTIWQKVLPAFTIAISFIPAIVYIGLAALIPADNRPDDLLPSYAEYYGFITTGLVVFTSFVAPEVLCTDRRTGMLGLYLASPLDRNTYLISKAAAVASVLAVVTMGPQLLMLVAYALIGDGPGGPLDYLVLVLRILLAGLSVSVLYTALSLAVSSFTARRAAASATIILMLLTSAIFVSSLTDQEGGAGWSPNLVVFDFITLPLALVFHIFGETEQIDRPYDDVSRSVLLLANLAWIVLFAAITRWRYQKMTVTR